MEKCDYKNSTLQYWYRYLNQYMCGFRICLFNCIMICVFVFMYVYIHMCLHILTCMYMSTYILYTYAFTYTYTYTYTYTFMRINCVMCLFIQFFACLSNLHLFTQFSCLFTCVPVLRLPDLGRVQRCAFQPKATVTYPRLLVFQVGFRVKGLGLRPQP